MVFGCPGWHCLFCDLLGIKQHAYQYNWVVSIVATEMWKFLSNSYVIITLCSVSMATTQSSIGTNVIVVTCYGNNNAWNPIDQPPYLVLYGLSCSPKSIPEKSVTVCMYHLHYSVYHNSLTSTGAIALAKALQQNKSLEELKWVANWFRNVLYGQTASFHWRSYTGSNYNYVHTGMWVLMLDEWSTVILCTTHLFHFTSCCIYSLEWDHFQWTKIGDDGAIALADPRVMKNFKTLK